MMSQKKIMLWIKKFLNRETVSYLIAGICTTLLAWGLFVVLPYFGAGTIAANNIANGLAVLFAFAVNKVFVFKSPSWVLSKILPEMCKFFASRLLTHVLETAVLYVLVDRFGFSAVIMKGLTMFFIQVLGNYALSKRVVFVKK
jgi:putative flippase GtrA